MEKIKKLKYELLDINNGVLIKLRSGDDIDDKIWEQLNLVKSIVADISKEWSKQKCLPKELCSIWVDFLPAFESCLPYCDKKTGDELLQYAD